MIENMIELKNVTKRYKEQIVLDHINMRFESGKIYGIIGRNGSGKTILLKHICGFVYPTEGTVSIEGKIIKKGSDIPSNIGAIIENPGFLNQYSGYKNLKILAMLRDQIDSKKIYEIMEVVGLKPYDKKPVGKYSLGMRQRLGIAQAIMEDPEILLLDEPMNGLDDKGVCDIRALLLEWKKRGKLIILASHNMEDIAVLCDEVYRMSEGKVVAVNRRW